MLCPQSFELRVAPTIPIIRYFVTIQVSLLLRRLRRRDEGKKAGTPRTPAGRTLHRLFCGVAIIERQRDTPHPGREDPAPPVLWSGYHRATEGHPAPRQGGPCTPLAGAVWMTC